MKISKSLLQAIFVGVTVGATATSCEALKKDTASIHLKDCGPNCDVDHARSSGEENENTPPYDNCPACGMG